MDCKEVLSLLEKLGNEEARVFKETKFGIHAANNFGVFQKDINEIAKQIGKNDKLAVGLRSLRCAHSLQQNIYTKKCHARLDGTVGSHL